MRAGLVTALFAVWFITRESGDYFYMFAYVDKNLPILVQRYVSYVETNEREILKTIN